jgi:hypothetical protein
MFKVKVIIEGTNCQINKEGMVRRYGFFATRIVNVETINEFSDQAKKAINAELGNIALNDPSSPPVLSVEFIEILQNDTDEKFSGFTWYPEDQTEGFWGRFLKFLGRKH